MGKRAMPVDRIMGDDDLLHHFAWLEETGRHTIQGPLVARGLSKGWITLSAGSFSDCDNNQYYRVKLTPAGRDALENC
jgi:hypothetical protein